MSAARGIYPYPYIGLYLDCDEFGGGGGGHHLLKGYAISVCGSEQGAKFKGIITITGDAGLFNVFTHGTHRNLKNR